MAGNPGCQNNDGQLAVFIGTNLDSGETVTLCLDDFVTFCATIVEGFTGAPIGEIIETIKAQTLTQEVDEELKESHDPGIEHTPNGEEFEVTANEVADSPADVQ